MAEEEKKAEIKETIIDNIDILIKSIAGERTTKELKELAEKVALIDTIIETSYRIGDSAEKYEQYKQQIKTTAILNDINMMLIPEFKDFIQKKFQQFQEELSEEPKPDPKKK